MRSVEYLSSSVAINRKYIYEKNKFNIWILYWVIIKLDTAGNVFYF